METAVVQSTTSVNSINITIMAVLAIVVIIGIILPIFLQVFFKIESRAHIFILAIVAIILIMTDNTVTDFVIDLFNKIYSNFGGPINKGV